MQRARDTGLRAGRVSGVMGHDVGEALDLTGWVVSREGMVHAPKRGASGAGGRHEGEIHGGLSL